MEIQFKKYSSPRTFNFQSSPLRVSPISFKFALCPHYWLKFIGHLPLISKYMVSQLWVPRQMNRMD